MELHFSVATSSGGLNLRYAPGSVLEKIGKLLKQQKNLDKERKDAILILTIRSGKAKKPQSEMGFFIYRDKGALFKAKNALKRACFLKERFKVR